MTSRFRPRLRLGVALLAATGLALAAGAPALAVDPEQRSYTGPAYSADVPMTPTATENQNKIWFAQDSWWALLLEPTGRTTRVHQLMPDHTWRPTPAVVNTDTGNVGDALPDGDRVHVISRAADGAMSYVRLTYDPAAGEYQASPPALVTTRGSQSPPSLALDGAGVLWVGFATVNTLVVTHSVDGGATWADVAVLATIGTGATPETAALVAFDDQIGIMWSDQAAEAFGFASHRDGTDPAAWTMTVAASGEALADNHISLVRVPGEVSDVLVAAVKTSRGDNDEPVESALIEVLVRAPDGTWSTTPVSTIADQLNDPVLQVDEATGTLHLFASSADGNIVTKRAPLDDISFSSGLGQVFVVGAGGRLIEPTTARRPADARSGLVVLASDAARKTYRHAELRLGPPSAEPDPTDRTAPEAPGEFEARALSSDAVLLSWGEVADEERWSPARDGVPAQEYVVLRDGEEVATVTSTSVQDRLGDAGGAAAGGTVRYEVVAVDASGNRSPAAQVEVDLPPAEESTGTIVAVGLLALAAGIGGYGLWRLRARST